MDKEILRRCKMDGLICAGVMLGCVILTCTTLGGSVFALFGGLLACGKISKRGVYYNEDPFSKCCKIVHDKAVSLENRVLGGLVSLAIGFVAAMLSLGLEIAIICSVAKNSDGALDYIVCFVSMVFGAACILADALPSVKGDRTKISVLYIVGMLVIVITALRLMCLSVI